jgi:ligand-binding SRPBCC domain-containing protein
MIVFETTARIRRPVDDVFAFVSDPLNFPRWNSAVQAVRRTSPGEAGIAATYSMERELPGGQATNALEVTASEPPREFAMRTTSGPTPFAYRYRFSGDDAETVITLEAQVELPGGARVLRRLATRAVKSGVDANLASLKRILEAGPRSAA